MEKYFKDTFDDKYGGEWDIVDKPPEVGDLFISRWNSWSGVDPDGLLVTTYYENEVHQVRNEKHITRMDYPSNIKPPYVIVVRK